MNRPPLRLLCCCLLLVLAGCGGQAANQSPETTTGVGTADVATTTEPVVTTSEDTATEQAPAQTTDSPPNTPEELPVNTSRLFERTATLLDVDFARPSISVDRVQWSRTVTVQPRGAFTTRLGVPNATRENELATAGQAISPSVVTVRVSNRSTPASLRMVLVHEYTHTIQLQLESFRNVNRIAATQSGTLGTAMNEGGATFVAQSYADRYEGVVPNQERFCAAYDGGDAATKVNFAPYCVGARYIDSRIDDPANLSAVYENPPNTTEQVRHNYSRSEEPPVPLSVNVSGTDNWSLTLGPPIEEPHRQGELWTYAVLTTHLSESRADTAATGWGNDTRVTFGSLDGTGDVWITRWDTERDADEFERAIADHVENATAGTVTDARFRVERVDSTTVVLVVGPETFLDDATVTVTDEGGVFVRPPNATVRVDTGAAARAG